MEFSYFYPRPNEDQQMIVDMVQGFASDELTRHAEQIDHDGKIESDLESQLAEMGLLGIPISEENGGAGFDFTSYVLALVELSKSSAATAMHVVNQTSLFLEPLSNNTEVHSAFVEVASGDARGALALCEDAGSWKPSTITMPCESMVLNGEKTGVLGAQDAQWLLVAAKENDALSFFVIECDRVGVELGKSSQRLGLRSLSSTSVKFANVAVTESDRVGASGEGASILEQIKVRGMAAVTAIACGLMAAGRDASALYATERRQFRRPIADFEAIRQRLASSVMGYGASMATLLSVARMIDEDVDATQLARIGKVMSSKAAIQATDDALQIYGGYGFSQEYPAERFYRDACCLGLLFGGNDSVTQDLAVAVIPQDH